MLIAFVSASQAALYFYDGFDYTENTLMNSVNTAGNWGSSGTGAPTNRTGSLTYTGLPASTGGKVELTGFRLAGSGSSSRTTWTGGDSQTTNLFASFLLNVASIGTSQSNATSGNFVFQLRSGKANVVVSNNAAVAANFNIGIQNNGTGTIVWDNNGGNGYLAGSTYFIVFSYTNSAADGTGTWGDQLWINPALESAPGTAQVTTKGINVVNTANKVAFGVGNGVADTSNRSVIYVDELRVGSTWGDVVIPEPATVGMLGLGGLVTLLIRRMRRN